MPTTRLSSSSSTIRSTRRNGCRWGRMRLMSGSSMGSVKVSDMLRSRVYRARGPRRGVRSGMLRWSDLPASSRPPKPTLEAKVLEELLPIVGEVNSVLDPEALWPTIARLLRRIIDYSILDLFVAQPDGMLTPAYYVGYDP